MNLTIVVSTQNKVSVPEEEIYLPVQAGAAGHKSIGYARDDTGINISKRNPRYSELTVLYWALHNIDAEYIGLVHYRRFFGDKGTGPSGESAWNHIAREKDFEELLSKVSLILPKKRHYYIETVGSHYAHTHEASHLQTMRDIILEQCPDFLKTYGIILNKRSMHIGNLVVMHRDLLKAYFDWLLPLLEELEKRTDETGYTPFQRRYAGRIAEILLNVWVGANRIPYSELPMAVTYKINWIDKGSAFLRAKFKGEKYERSY